MMAPTSLSLDPLFHALADPTRRRILHALKGRSPVKEYGLCAFEIEKRVRLAQPTISHHMWVLEQANLVEARRDGHRRRYRRNEKLIAEFLRTLKQQL